jgi:hypothetical protein
MKNLLHLTLSIVLIAFLLQSCGNNNTKQEQVRSENIQRGISLGIEIDTILDSNGYLFALAIKNPHEHIIQYKERHEDVLSGSHIFDEYISKKSVDTITVKLSDTHVYILNIVEGSSGRPHRLIKYNHRGK